MSFLKKLKRKKKKEETIEIPKEWLEQERDEEVVTETVEAIETVEPPEVKEVEATPLSETIPILKTKRTRRKIRVPGLFKVKWIMAFILFIVNAVSCAMFVMENNTESLVYFIPSTIILLDYLIISRRNRKEKWYQPLHNIEEELE